MPLGQWLTTHFKKVLTQLLWKMEKIVKTLIVFFPFLIKLSLNGLLTIALRASVSIFLK